MTQKGQLSLINRVVGSPWVTPITFMWQTSSRLNDLLLFLRQDAAMLSQWVFPKQQSRYQVFNNINNFNLWLSYYMILMNLCKKDNIVCLVLWFFFKLLFSIIFIYASMLKPPLKKSEQLVQRIIVLKQRLDLVWLNGWALERIHCWHLPSGINNSFVHQTSALYTVYLSNIAQVGVLFYCI